MYRQLTSVTRLTIVRELLWILKSLVYNRIRIMSVSREIIHYASAMGTIDIRFECTYTKTIYDQRFLGGFLWKNLKSRVFLSRSESVTNLFSPNHYRYRLLIGLLFHKSDRTTKMKLPPKPY